MTIERRNFDLLGGVKTANSPLWLSFHGFRKTLSHHLGLKTLPFIMHDDTKATLRKEYGSQYPYGFYRMNSFQIIRDQAPGKTVRRHGSAWGYEGATNAQIHKAYMFPAEIMMELHYINDDPAKVIHFVEKVSILGATGSFSFKVKLPGVNEFSCRISVEDGPIEIPQVELENESDAGAFEIVVPFKMTTKVGVIKGVPKINNQGAVEQSISVDPVPGFPSDDDFLGVTDE